MFARKSDGEREGVRRRGVGSGGGEGEEKAKTRVVVVERIVLNVAVKKMGRSRGLVGEGGRRP